MFSFETHTAPAFKALTTTANGFEKAAGKIRSALTIAFVAVLAADHAQTAKTASSYVVDKVPGVKEGTMGVYRSQTVSFFQDTARVASLRAAIVNPEAMTPEEFMEAVSTYALTLDVLGAYEAKLKANKAAKDRKIDAKADTVSDTSAPFVPTQSPTETLAEDHAQGAQAIANLITATTWADPVLANAARLALADLIALASAAIEAVTAPVIEEAEKIAA